MAMPELKFDRYCTACGKTRSQTKMVFDPTNLNNYCKDITDCNEDNPNSFQNVVKRGHPIEMMTFGEAKKAYAEFFADEVENKNSDVAKLLRFMSHPTSLRLESMENAKFILQFKEQFGFNSISAAINGIIAVCRRAAGIEDGSAIPPLDELFGGSEVPEFKPAPEPQPEPQPETEQPKPQPDPVPVQTQPQPELPEPTPEPAQPAPAPEPAPQPEPEDDGLDF